MVERVLTWWDGYAGRQVREEGVAAETMSLALSPLRTRLRSVQKFSAHSGLPLEEGVRVREVDPQWSSADVLAVQVADRGERSVVVLEGGERR